MSQSAYQNRPPARKQNCHAPATHSGAPSFRERAHDAYMARRVWLEDLTARMRYPFGAKAIPTCDYCSRPTGRHPLENLCEDCEPTPAEQDRDWLYGQAEPW